MIKRRDDASYYVSHADPTQIGPTGKLGAQPWMGAPATRAVIAALRSGGADVRFVGGCIRDAFSNRPVRDVDIGTPDPPERVIELLEEAGLRALPTGIDHGTVSALVDNERFEITTLRLDLATDGRRAKVAFTNDWVADAARRDFTINAMSCTPDGDVYDPFGGIADLGNGIVQFVGNAQERIGEDYLRLLRFFRFYAEFGRPPVDRDALAACRQLAPELSRLSGERVRDEFLRILAAQNAADIILLMQGERVLEHIIPTELNIGRLRMMLWLDTTAIRLKTVKPDPLRRLAALIETDADGATELAGRLKLSRRQAERLISMSSSGFKVSTKTEDATLRRAIYEAGGHAVRDWALLAWAGEMAVEPRREPDVTQGWVSVLETTQSWKPPTLPVSGADVTALGVDEGPEVGNLLRAVESWWIDEDFTPDREACLAELAAHSAN
ncbi:MAG: CCA tRNA nucleotidyltransferase [Rhodospirillales bacterium]|jgi:poly(A) polymerase|nr:CCA tRNA nucleotidyltransferase [Rhodospirillales bacterium]